MPLTMPDLESYLRAIGDAVIFVGDPFTVDGLEELGAKEGDISVAFNPEFNNLTFPENTGPQVHEADLMGEAPVITLPMIIGNPDLWEKLSVTGSVGGGYSSPQPVQETSLVLVPRRELQAAGANDFSYPNITPGPWADPPGAPVNWFWAWRGYFTRPDITFRVTDGGRAVTSATFVLMHHAANPEGQKLYTIGDPIAAGVTAVRI